MALLYEFLLRVTFGLALGMAVTSPREVTSGYFRNHLFVTFGLMVLAALIAGSSDAHVWPSVVAAGISYVGSVCWLYEAKRFGRTCLCLVAAAALAGLTLHATAALPEAAAPLAKALRLLVPATSGLVTGLTMAAMLLGHWYLNSPSMDIDPLARLLRLLAAAIVLQAIVSGCGLWGEIALGRSFDVVAGMLLVLRWAFGIAGSAILVGMTWHTLKIPNTQSATGILYVALVAVFVGELSGQLLSVESVYPL